MVSVEDVARLYDLQRPGKYAIQVGRRFHNSPNEPLVLSNSLTITVTPKR